MATPGALMRHALCLQVIFNSRPTSCAPGGPKAPVVRPRWNSSGTGEASPGLWPYLIVFVIFPVSVMLLCICAKHATKWCTRQLAAFYLCRPAASSSSSNNNINPPDASERWLPSGTAATAGFLSSRSNGDIRTISGGRHYTYSDLRSLSGFFSFRPSWQSSLMTSSATPIPRPAAAAAVPVLMGPNGSCLLPPPGRGAVHSSLGPTSAEWADDPPPCYPAEEPPPTYESLFDRRKGEPETSVVAC